MSFILRKIRRRPNGQEIVRDTPIDKQKLSVGRSTDCDVYLPDLRVSLNHADIEHAGSSIKIFATSDKPVKFEGKFGSRFSFQTKNNAEVAIGPYLLKLSKDQSSDALVIAVERVEEKTSMLQPEDQARIFSLKKTILGKRASAWVLSLASIFMFVALPLFYFYTDRNADLANPIEIRQDQELLGLRTDIAWMSGDMSIAHTSLADNCNACHVNAFEATKDETGLSSGCHDGLRNHAEQPDLVTAKAEPSAFGSMLKEVADFAGKADMRCAACHMEHNGREGVILNTESTCYVCHDNMDQRLTETELINVKEFSLEDHPNFRATVVVKPHETEPVTQRVSLDENPTSYSGLKFPHDVHLEEGGSVANQARDFAEQYGFGEKLECEDCHTENASGALFLPVQMEQHCGMCHSLEFERDPVTNYARTLRHGEPEDVIASMADFYNSSAALLFDQPKERSGRRRPGEAAQVRQEIRISDALAGASGRTKDRIRDIFTEGGACYDCHTIIAPTDPDSVEFDISPVSVEESFMPKSVFHHESHEGMECLDCHEAETSANAEDVLMPGIDNCLECHRGEDTVNFIPSTCLMCHEYHDDDHMPFMEPAKTKRHASIWPSRRDTISNEHTVKLASELSFEEDSAK